MPGTRGSIGLLAITLLAALSAGIGTAAATRLQAVFNASTRTMLVRKDGQPPFCVCVCVCKSVNRRGREAHVSTCAYMYVQIACL
jgi:hypothetical protein